MSLDFDEQLHTGLEPDSWMEFHVSKGMRDRCHFDLPLFASTGNIILSNLKNVRLFTKKINDTIDPVLHPEQIIKAGQLNAMGLIDEVFHLVCSLYRKQEAPNSFKDGLQTLEKKFGKDKIEKLLLDFTEEFPPVDVYQNTISHKDYLAASTNGISNKVTTLEEFMLLKLANENPAFGPFLILFNDKKLAENPIYDAVWAEMQNFFKAQPLFGPNYTDLISMLREPVIASPYSLKGQLDYIRQKWAAFLGEWLLRLLAGMDIISEEEKPGWSGTFSGPPPMEVYNYDSLMTEYERFSPDREWMPRVILIAKTVLVWLDQLTKKYKTEITGLDQIPDQELDLLAQQGFTGLWLIGLWERSWASKRIKQINGNPEAAASAYSLHDYEIADNLGGWDGLENLRRRLWYRGIRLASDMVPNHTGMDAKWVVEKPQLFVQRSDCPFPTYTFNGENLSLDSRVSVYLEDHYYSKNDCAVVFKRVDNYTGETRYIYHGNDGTGMPWNDTAQIDFLNPDAREEVIQEILHVARNFPIIRFDAAMVLAKKHIRRLWYPEPGQGGDIASRSESAINREEFEKRIPTEFWREVVDRVAKEVPDTLLLAEAFWMMEGYFVRTLGMHRVYNSAFMNMLKREENSKYRATVKNTMEFDSQVLKRFVNFMNNPDEETAVAQFGKGDKYFGVCTLMVTMPGLPMFGHGQIQGFQEKYGMEFTKAYWDEVDDIDLIERHKQVIFPLMKKRYLFSEIENFCFYDVWNNGSVNENIYAYSNRFGTESAVVFYNNVYDQASGWIKESCPSMINHKSITRCIADAIGLENKENGYCIFQEQKSGLWYIRSNKDLFEKGMFVHLNGFEYQVLWNISQVIDDSTEKYRVLCETLNGKGVPDIDIALKEIFLKDLYCSLSNFATPEFFEGIGALCAPILNPKAITLKKLLKNHEEKGKIFFSTLKEFIDGNYGSSTVIDCSKTGKEVLPDTIWKHFTARIGNLLKIIQWGRDGSTEAITPAGCKLIQKFFTGITTTPFLCEILAGYIILYSIRDVIGDKATANDTERLINLWCLDRKLRDLLVEGGKPSKDLFYTFKVLLEGTRFCDANLKKEKLQQSCYNFILGVLSSEQGAMVLGLNNFDNVLWFNKEKADQITFIAILLYVLLSTKKCDYDLLLEVWDILNTKQQASAYNANRFAELLKPAVTETKKTKTVKQTAVKADTNKKTNKK